MTTSLRVFIVLTLIFISGCSKGGLTERDLVGIWATDDVSKSTTFQLFEIFANGTLIDNFNRATKISLENKDGKTLLRVEASFMLNHPVFSLDPTTSGIKGTQWVYIGYLEKP